jgi:hypothetical protein
VIRLDCYPSGKNQRANTHTVAGQRRILTELPLTREQLVVSLDKQQ